MQDINYNFYKSDINYRKEKNENRILQNITSNTVENDIGVFCEMSDIRDNILKWYPFKKEASLLEIGDKYGSLTNFLCDNVSKVKCIEFNKKNAELIQKRNEFKINLEIICGNLKDIELEEKFDYITLFGTLEYAKELQFENKEELFNNVKRFLKKDGIILIAINNRFGVKNYISNNNLILDDTLPSKIDIENMIEKSGFNNYKFYYPLPDYKLTNVIFTDEYLPDEKNIETYSPYYDKIQNNKLVDEIKLYKQIITEHKDFRQFANSYFVEISNEVLSNNIKFCKFNCKRKKEYRLITILKGDTFQKIPENDLAKNHLENMINNMEKFNYENVILYDYVENGVVKSERVKDLQTQNYNIHTKEDADKYLNDMENMLKQKTIPYQPDNLITKYLNDLNLEEQEKIKELEYIENGFFDGIFSNTFIVDNKICFYDQEWMDRNVPLKFILFRCIVCDLNLFNLNQNWILFKEHGIDETFIHIFDRLESRIQSQIVNNDANNFFKEHGHRQDKKITFIDDVDYLEKERKILELENEKYNLEHDLNQIKNMYNEVVDSKFWKRTEILRKINNKFGKEGKK